MILLFEIGSIAVTKSARKIAEKNNFSNCDLLHRHVFGDFGDYGCFYKTDITDDEIKNGILVTSDYAKINKWGIVTGKGKVYSNYGDILIVTEVDRSKTTIQTVIEYDG